MPDSSQKNLGLHDNFSADDELKTGALADGVAMNTSSRSVAGGSTSLTETAGVTLPSPSAMAFPFP
ncbi:hypothetical protein N0Q90_17420 [Sinorhizobium sp. M103]|nr:hypothetical protein [Sinorhizobium sp. M103]WEJ09813.1 hypothetical protein N0Q90_17420 [Sinorhizobium sp. M103]